MKMELNKYTQIAVIGKDSERKNNLVSKICQQGIKCMAISDASELARTQSIDAVVIPNKEDVDAITDSLHRKCFIPIILEEELWNSGKKDKAEKAAIFTFFNVDENYGQTLQAFAVQHILSSLDVDNEIINFSYRAISPKKRKGLFRPGLRRRLGFRRFIHKRLKTTVPCKTKSDISKVIKGRQINTLVCGSDQIWNFFYHRFDGDMYFANIPALWHLRKVAYAPSMGVSRVDNEEEAKFRHQADLIDRFDSISVREESGANILRGCLPNRNVECLLDPVFMISADKWRNVSKPMRISGSYILCYCVGNIERFQGFFGKLRNKFDSQICMIGPISKDVCKKLKGVKIIQPDPSEFLWCVDHADCIVGDSFHAAAFSIIFHKEFYLVHRQETKVGGYDKDGRIQNLQEKLGVDSRFVEDDGNGIERIQPLNYRHIDLCIRDGKEKAFRYLKEALFDEKTGMGEDAR